MHHSYVSLTDVYIFLRIAIHYISAIVYLKVVFLYISLNLCCVYRHAFYLLMFSTVNFVVDLPLVSV